ncbi:hypothetical protein [Streptacidiphilus fuscans]|uniref:Uncharacterized protein n=1 Tax=Streptacidiphilus fuscans TaxID=2789292 RepID=A0A931BEE9_9ACTN|nr:hypothetical protein [Streptacidiphilus fuscans]MBF9072668.1 hypothetical protein [Streptacidiphilus fuscans]
MSTATVVRGALVVAALASVGFGAYGMLTDPYINDPLDVGVWAVGGAVLHDGLWLPLVCLVGAALPRLPWTVRGGLVVAATLSAVGLPAVLDAGNDHGNATLLPLPYLRNWLVLLGVTAALTLLVEGVRRARRARREGRWSGRPGRASRRSPGRAS